MHGAYDDLVRLLRAANLVDADLRWSAGTSHAVSLGDLVDRGAGSRKVMDLLMRLQGEAAASGGSLHVVLGNHEAMNLLGDLRDTNPQELAADGGPAGHRAALSRDGVYGRWLSSLPVAVVIGDTLFIHGGPSQVVAGLSLGEINRRYRTALTEYLAALDPMLSGGLVRPDDPFADRGKLAEKRFASSKSRRVREAEVLRFLDADADPMLDADGPNWSRAAALCREVSEADVLEPILERLGVKRLVVGHTVTRSRRVVSRFDGTVVKLDTGMNRAVFHGRPSALVLEQGAATAIYADESGAPAPIAAEPLYVSALMPEDAVEAVLASGSVGATGTTPLTVTLEGATIAAAFTEASADAARKEVAAYRLDRALRLGLVPATVEREVGGRRGVLQARPGRWVTQAEVETRALRPDGWCPLPPQVQLMDAFDALIGNDGRTRERMLYDPAEWTLLLTEHAGAFGMDAGLPPHLQSHPPRPGPELKRRLASLDAEMLAGAVGDLLSAGERAALLARRDALLER